MDQAGQPDWQRYERMVAAIESENQGIGIELTATKNAEILAACRAEYLGRSTS